MQCGRHGYSARDGGFRFDVSSGEGRPSHPQAGDPLLVEDPVDVFNNVARNCFRASLVQRAFFDAYERLKGEAVRHHRHSPRVRAPSPAAGDRSCPPAGTASSPSDMRVKEDPVRPAEASTFSLESDAMEISVHANTNVGMHVDTNVIHNESHIAQMRAKFERISIVRGADDERETIKGSRGKLSTGVPPSRAVEREGMSEEARLRISEARAMFSALAPKSSEKMAGSPRNLSPLSHAPGTKEKLPLESSEEPVPTISLSLLYEMFGVSYA